MRNQSFNTSVLIEAVFLISFFIFALICQITATYFTNLKLYINKEKVCLTVFIGINFYHSKSKELFNQMIFNNSKYE